MKCPSFSLLLLAGFSTAAKAVESNPSVRRTLGGTTLADERSIPFPRVYSAVVPSPSQDPPGGDHIYFAAEVDFLDTLEVCDASAKISFMVHDAEELAYFESLISQEQAAQNLQIQHALTDNLQHQINYSDNGFSTRLTSPYSKIDGFSCYKNLAGTFEWMDDMVTKGGAIQDLTVTLTDIGDSYLKTQDQNNGYDIMVMKITGSGTSSSSEKSVFFSMSGIHAREYAPPELSSRWAESLIDAYGNDADITAMLDHTEIHLVFQSNPDGRSIAETNKVAMRRKNVNPNGNSFFCGNRYGVDLNRNFPFAWGFGSGSSNNKCSDTYRGTAPASQPEVKAIVDYVSTLFPEGQRKADPEADKQVPFDEATTTGVFFDIHAYGEIVIWPWGHENLESGNDSGFEALASKYRHFNGYDNSGPLDGYLYADSGNIKALTYSAKTAKAPYSLSKGPDVTSLSVTVNGNSITVNTAISDSAWSASNHATAQQGVGEVRLFVNEHPDDTSGVGDEVSGGSSTVDISSLPSGQHTVYVQATDSDGYKGPVTAAYFNKEAGGDPAPSPVASPFGTPTRGPTGGSDPVASPVGSPTRDPTGGSPDGSPEECVDTTATFPIIVTDLEKDCDWLAINMVRFSFLCQFIEGASACPLTCQKCGLFD